MSAIDTDKEPAAVRGMRIVEAPPSDTNQEEKERRPIEILRCSYRPPGADFYCWKYGVWYNLMDCCSRHQENTFEGCGDCGQGRNNLKANLERYRDDLKRRTQFGPRTLSS
jgi:hypothetical protein